MKTVAYLFVFAASVAASACQSGVENQAPASSAPAPQTQSAAAPTPETNRLQAFVPPSDGKLSAAQVERYISVRRRALEIVREKKSASPAASAVAEIPAETQAAGELGRDLAEYRWVQARIAEASTTELPEGAAAVLKAIESSAMKNAADIQQAAAEERRIPIPAAPDPSVVSFNRSVLDPFRTELAAVEKS